MSVRVNRKGSRYMWSFTPTKENVHLFNELKKKFDQKNAEINRSAFINMALERVFKRMNNRSIKEMIEGD